MSTVFGWRDEAVDGGGGVEVLHRHLEAEILGGLVADRLHHRIGHADMAQLDVLDLLRPDRRDPRMPPILPRRLRVRLRP